MQAVAPNLSTLIGDTVGARLIAHAGSLTNLAKYPASTVQILGAEKARRAPAPRVALSPVAPPPPPRAAILGVAAAEAGWLAARVHVCAVVPYRACTPPAAGAEPGWRA